ncbi:hypothetical protein DXG01_001453 [Tephrocybe rancida]|nr:hypothetical protein DXG01_001453 [Tephrocybe rancida]
MPKPAPAPSPPRKRARAHDQPFASDPSSPNPLTEPSQCTTTPRAIRVAKRRRLSGPMSPTITPTITAPLPLGSIAMLGSAALLHPPVQVLAASVLTAVFAPS